MTPERQVAESSSREPKRLGIPGTEDSMMVDDFVRLRCGQSTSVVKITKFEPDNSRQGKHKVHVKWCLRPEETKAGRQPFHGVNELLVSDRETVEEWTSVVGTCNVLSIEDSMKRSSSAAGDGDGDGPTYFWRFEYETESGSCYRIDYYCIKCNGRYRVGPLTLEQQLTGNPPEFTCPAMCFARYRNRIRDQHK